jgi:predicted small secreted protein
MKKTILLIAAVILAVFAVVGAGCNEKEDKE